MEHRSNVSSCLGLPRSQRLGRRAKASCKCRNSQNLRFTFQLHGETSHSKDYAEAGEPALKAMHRKNERGNKRRCFSMKKSFPIFLEHFMAEKMWGTAWEALGVPAKVIRMWMCTIHGVGCWRRLQGRCHLFTILIHCWHCPVSLRCCTL